MEFITDPGVQFAIFSLAFVQFAIGCAMLGETIIDIIETVTGKTIAEILKISD